MKTTFYWHDYETFGTHPALDRPCQFAGVRTDDELNEVDKALKVFCQPPDDYVPHPEACLVTGITPQLALQKGLREHDFATRIHGEFARPGTCGVGYNSLRFDDEFTRHLFYRNLYDPYGREWQHGNSRWDLIDVTRMCCALRPQGIVWPLGENGAPTFRLEALTAANDIGHADAHDALSDVRATIALARLLRKAQPKLWNYALKLRDKNFAGNWLDVNRREPVLHVSSRYPAAQGCLALVLPLARHPVNANATIVWNLAEDPRPLLEQDAETLRAKLYMRSEDLAAGEARLALKQVHRNKSPMLVTPKMLDQATASRHGIDRAVCERHLAMLKDAPDLAQKIKAVYSDADFDRGPDPELGLYGAFISNRDRVSLDRLRQMPPAQLAAANPVFEDSRLPEMLFRYRARNFPETLSSEEGADWREHCQARLLEGKPEGVLTVADCRRRIEELRQQRTESADTVVLDALGDYLSSLLPGENKT